MNEVGFRNWLSAAGKSKKIQSDMVSRLKTLQRELNFCDIDLEFSKDRCRHILQALAHKGNNEIMESYGNVKLPVGMYSLSTYRYALRAYIRFLETEQ